MSNKLNNYSGRRQEKPAPGNYSNRNTNHGHEDKRPSVFDRLGVRRDNVGSGGNYSQSQSSHNHPEGQTFKRMDHKSNMRPGNVPTSGSGTQMAASDKKRLYNREKDTYRGRSRSRSHSSSPKKKGVTPTSTFQNKKKMKAKPGSNYQSDGGNASRKYSNLSPKGDSGSGKINKQRYPIKSRGKPEKKNKKIKKSKRSSSVSSDDSSSGGNSSSSGSSGSQSSSSSYSGSSSSSSADSSSSDSSVPSIKLKPDKKSKTKKRSAKDKGKVKTVEKSVKKPLVSSSSSIDPHEDNTKSLQWSGQRRDKPGIKDLPFMSDDKANVNRDIRKDRYQRDYQEDSRKRKLSGGGGYEAENSFKRNRLTPPQNKCKTAPMRSLSPRRAPPGPNTLLPKMKNESSPGPGGRDRMRLLRTPPRRPPYEEPRKQDLPKDKPMNSINLVRARDMDYDSMQHSARPMSGERYGYDKPGYKKEDMRPRERIAPVRNPGLLRRGRMTPEADRDRGKEMQKEYEHRGKTPLLSTPYPQQMHDRNKPGGMMMRQQLPMEDDRRMKPFGNEPYRKHSPLLVKTKEELSEKYDELKLSRVDMWVDETLKGTSVRDVVTEKQLSPKKTILEKKIPFEDIKDKLVLGNLGNEVKVVKQLEDSADKEEDFSDFSDDADEILNKEADVKFDDSPEGIEVQSVTKEKVEEKIPEPVEKPVTVTEPVVVEEPVVVVEKEKPVTAEPTFLKFRERDQKNVTLTSLRSQSQTEDDLFETMHFEEISDEELGEVENKIGIVDALGVDWASLVCEKKYGPVDADVKTSIGKVRERWRPIEIIKQIGISKKHIGEELKNKIAAKIAEKDGQVEDFGYPMMKKENHYDTVLERLGLGPNSRALSSRRDMATRYCFMEMLPRNLTSMDLFRSTTTTVSTHETD